MKKLAIFTFLAAFALSNAQTSTLQFTDKLVYEKKNNNEKNTFPEMFYTNSGALLKGFDYDENMMHFFDAKDQRLFYIYLELGNKISINKTLSYYQYYSDEDRVTDEENYRGNVTKTNEQETIANKKCTNYTFEIFSKETENKNEPLSVIKLCVDEKSNVNNVTAFISPGGFFINYYLPNTKLKGTLPKGLVLKVTENDSEIGFTLKSAEKINETALFDLDNQKKETLEYAKKVREEYGKYTDVAEAAVDATEAGTSEAYSEEYSIPKYESTYKNTTSSNFAISTLPNEKLWEGLPKHCRKIDDAIPNFEDKELKSHLRNYVGQMCDMYLTQYEYHNVAIKETLDEIRRESLYLNEARKKASKKDTEKLDQFLNQLD